VTKRLPRRDSKRHLTLQDMLILRGGSPPQIEARFGDMGDLIALYQAHPEIDRFGHPGIRSACWWIVNIDPKDWPTDDPDATIDGRECFWRSQDPAEEARQIIWLHERGELRNWERQSIIETAKRDVGPPPNEFFPPSPETQEAARRLLEVLDK
jgi:hypothetical protein